jgi:hypothetical protein
MSAGNDNDPPAKAQLLPSLNPSLSKPSHPQFVKQEPMPSPAPADLAPPENGIHHRDSYTQLQPVGIPDAPQHFAQPRELPVPDEAEIEAALAHIETKQMGDLDGSAPFEHDEWRQRNLKRGLEVISGETAKRKVFLQLAGVLRAMLTCSETPRGHSNALPRCPCRPPRLRQVLLQPGARGRRLATGAEPGDC